MLENHFKDIIRYTIPPRNIWFLLGFSRSKFPGNHLFKRIIIVSSTSFIKALTVVSKLYKLFL